MAADLMVEPWSRLAALAPPGTSVLSLQSAADRYLPTVDVYASAADLWEEVLVALVPPMAPTPGSESAIRTKTQGDLSVTYVDPVGIYASQLAAYTAKVRYFRSRSKAGSVLLREGTPLVYDVPPWVEVIDV